MKEKINQLKNYVEENIETIGGIGGTVFIVVTSFALGRISAKEDIEIRVTSTNEKGIITRESYGRRIK